MTPPTDGPYQQVGRRTLIRSAASGAVACGLMGCGGGKEAATQEGARPTGSVADVPVRGGIVVDDTYVITQPRKGKLKAFTAICTHQGCPVTSVRDNAITCNCHGSQFDAGTGEPISGPNGSDPGTISALKPEALTVRGDTYTLG